MSDEIKEILEDYKKLSGEITLKLDNTAEYESWLIIQDYVDKFLDYINNLEKRNKEIYDGFMATTKELSEYATKNEKAIEYIDRMTRVIDYDDDEFITWKHIEDIEKILRGNDNNER